MVLLKIDEYFNYSTFIPLYLFQRVVLNVQNSNYYENQHSNKVI